MIVEMVFVIFLVLLVFGPKKTLEMSQKVGQSIAQFKRAASQVQGQIQAELLSQQPDSKRPDLLASIFQRRN